MTNISSINGVTDLFGMSEVVHEQSGGFFYLMLLFTIWMILFISGRARNMSIDDLFIADSFFVLLLTAGFVALGLLGEWTLIFPLVMMFVGIILKYNVGG